MAKNDFPRVKKLGKYLKKERKRLILILLILIPVALAGAIQPLLVGQAISVLRGEDTIPFFDNLSNEYREDDLNTYGLTDMHEVRSDIVKTSDHPSNVLPPSIIDLYNRNRQNLEFWTEPEVIKINPPKAPTSYNIFS